MSRSWRALLMTGAMAVTIAPPVTAQIAPMGQLPPKTQPAPAQARPNTQAPAAKTGPDALAPSNPDFKQEVVVTQTPTPLPVPPAVWDVPNALALLTYIGGVGKEGLEPADYDPRRFRPRSRAVTSRRSRLWRTPASTSSRSTWPSDTSASRDVLTGGSSTPI